MKKRVIANLKTTRHCYENSARQSLLPGEKVPPEGADVGKKRYEFAGGRLLSESVTAHHISHGKAVTASPQGEALGTPKAAGEVLSRRCRDTGDQWSPLRGGVEGAAPYEGTVNPSPTMAIRGAGDRKGRPYAVRLLSLLLALLLLFSLAGCHGTLVPLEEEVEEKDPATIYAIPDSFDTSRDYTITFWAKNDTNSTQVAIYKQAIADFESCYPNITVELRLYTDYGRIYNDVITNIATNTTPNVCITYPDHIATYLTGEGTVVPLDGLMADEAYGLGGREVAFDSVKGEEVIEEFLEEGRFDGFTYALPFLRSTEACYVNKTYVEALGYTVPDVLTWDFIWEVSEKAMEKDADGNFRVNGQKVLIPFLYKSTDNMMIQMLRQLDAGYTTDSGEVLLFNDTTTQLLQTIASHSASGAFNTFKLVGYPANFLNAGQCIFAVDSTAGATWMGSSAPLVDIPEEKLVQFETVVRPVPQFDVNAPTMISQGPSVCLFNKEDPQEVLASWLFAQFLLTDDVQIPYAQTEGYVPVTTKARESDTYQDYLARAGEDNDLHYSIKMDATRLLLENTDKTFVTPVFNGSASVRNAAGQLIESANKAARRGDTVNASAVRKIYSEVSTMYRLDQITSSEGLGRLPAASLALLIALALCWAGMGGYLLLTRAGKKKSENLSGGH